jgi:hypothetical protein
VKLEVAEVELMQCAHVQPAECMGWVVLWVSHVMLRCMGVEML